MYTSTQARRPPPPMIFFFALSAQRSVMAMIIPLPHYDFFLWKNF